MQVSSTLLKALADETRLNIVKLLLRHNPCVGEIARSLELSEAAISQHLKVLKEAGLLVGEKHGYFMHYDVDRDALKKLGGSIAELATIEREPCLKEADACSQTSCSCEKSGEECSAEEQFFCHGIGDLRKKA